MRTDRVTQGVCPAADCTAPVYVEWYFETGGWFPVGEDEDPVCENGHDLGRSISGDSDSEIDAKIEAWYDSLVPIPAGPLERCTFEIRGSVVDRRCRAWTSDLRRRIVRTTSERNPDSGDLEEVGSEIVETYLCPKGHLFDVLDY